MIEQQSYLNVTVKVCDKELIIQLIQLYLDFKILDDEDLEKSLRKNFSKADFLKFAKSQITCFGLDMAGIGDGNQDYDCYRETAQKLFNKFYTH